MSEVAIELREGRVWVEARVSGRPLRGIFDTGSDGTAIDSESARSIGLVTQGHKSGSTVAGDISVEKVGRVDFDVGGAVLASSEANALPLSMQLDGLQFILGFDAMASSPFVLRLKERRISFEPFEHTKGSAFALEGDIRATARLKILGSTSHAFLDTGSPSGISLPRRWVDANARRLGIDAQASESRKILGSEFKSLRFTLEEVVLGSSRLADVPAEAVESEGGSFAEQSTFWGNVGTPVMGRFESIAIDGQARRLAFGTLL
jgi:hypothetical protein